MSNKYVEFLIIFLTFAVVGTLTGLIIYWTTQNEPTHTPCAAESSLCGVTQTCCRGTDCTNGRCSKTTPTPTPVAVCAVAGGACTTLKACCDKATCFLGKCADPQATRQMKYFTIPAFPQAQGSQPSPAVQTNQGVAILGNNSGLTYLAQPMTSGKSIETNTTATSNELQLVNDAYICTRDLELCLSTSGNWVNDPSSYLKITDLCNVTANCSSTAPCCNGQACMSGVCGLCQEVMRPSCTNPVCNLEGIWECTEYKAIPVTDNTTMRYLSVSLGIVSYLTTSASNSTKFGLYNNTVLTTIVNGEQKFAVAVAPEGIERVVFLTEQEIITTYNPELNPLIFMKFSPVDLTAFKMTTIDQRSEVKVNSQGTLTLVDSTSPTQLSANPIYFDLPDSFNKPLYALQKALFVGPDNTPMLLSNSQYPPTWFIDQGVSVSTITGGARYELCMNADRKLTIYAAGSEPLFKRVTARGTPDGVQLWAELDTGVELTIYNDISLTFEAVRDTGIPLLFTMAVGPA